MNEKFEALKTVSKYLVNLINGIEKAVEYFQGGEERKGCDLILPITEGIQWMTDALLVTKDVHKQNIDLKNINEKLNEIVDALENRDFVLIGDLFQYELIPVLKDIQNDINKTIEN
ncbi:hypothetical protein FDB23_09650 [Clostridium botulinum]|nr:hypothetical protein [Clostridium botulinum]